MLHSVNFRATKRCIVVSENGQYIPQCSKIATLVPKRVRVVEESDKTRYMIRNVAEKLCIIGDCAARVVKCR